MNYRQIKITPHIVERVLMWAEIISGMKHLQWTKKDSEVVFLLIEAEKVFYKQRNKARYNRLKNVPSKN